MSTIAILAEDTSDVEALKYIVRRALGQERLPLWTKGYGGGGDLLSKGVRDIRQLQREGVQRFVVCHDADTESWEAVDSKVRRRLLTPTGIAERCCVAVPVQELEAWLIADEQAINAVITSFRFGGHRSPEQINSPKEWLRSESRRAGGKPLYVPKMHNPRVAERLRLEVVGQKCPSFRRFAEGLAGWRGDAGEL